MRYTVIEKHTGWIATVFQRIDKDFIYIFVYSNYLQYLTKYIYIFVYNFNY